MFMNYKLVEQDSDIKEIEIMSAVIWPITYKHILSPNQIKYMLNKYLSVDSIKANIKDGYTYIILYNEENTKIGFACYIINKDKVFLSKLYFLPNAQNKGYGTKVINFLKSYKLPIELTVTNTNNPAYDTYLHMGFKVTESVTTDIGEGFYMDDYVMVLK